MVMDPRTHPRGAAPDFALPKPNPDPQRMTDALWWLVCMRLRLEPKSQNGGTYTNKPGSHNIGSQLPDYGPGDSRTDHSIRNPANRRGPWWRTKTAAHDWTFTDAQAGDYTTIKRYTNRAINAMKDPNDPRPDNAVFYVLGQADNDTAVEGWNERDDGPETSSDHTHNWHIHDSFWRDTVGDYASMWGVLTIDMGWTVAEWRQSLEDDVTAAETWTTDGLIPNPGWRFDAETNKFITGSTAVVVAIAEAHASAVNTGKLLEAQAQATAKLDALLRAQDGGQATIDTIHNEFATFRNEISTRFVAQAVPLLVTALQAHIGDLTPEVIRDAVEQVERKLAAEVATGPHLTAAQ